MSQEPFYHKRCKRLSYALGLSFFLNISLITFGIYEWQEAGFSFLAVSSFRPQQSKCYRQAGKELPTLTQSFRELEALDFEGLKLALRDEMPVAIGYKKQNISLSLLVHKHYFDITKALGGQMPERRLFSYMSNTNESFEIALYPDLSPEQFANISEFAKNEKWPFTLEGMLCKYKENEVPNRELQDVIFQTDEYRSVEILLTRGTPISKDEVFNLVLNIDYNHIKNLHKEMLKAQDFSSVVRRGFLVGALPQASEILFKTDSRFCLHTLPDKQTLCVLEALSKNPEIAKVYALALLEEPRSKVIWTKAQNVLCEILQLDSQAESRNSLLQRFGKIPPQASSKPLQKAPDTKVIAKPALPKTELIKQELTKQALTKQAPVKTSGLKKPNALPVKPQIKPSITPTATKPVTTKPVTKPTAKLVTRPAGYEIVYIVQQGDTLWQISKRYNIDIVKLKNHNKLTSDSLKPGSTLRIPQNS